MTSKLRRKDIDEYGTKYKEAAQKNNEVKELQRESEECIATRNHCRIGRWKEAVAKARKFFKSQYFSDYAKDLVTLETPVKEALNYPRFDFDREGLERFYKIHSLGHLIEVYKNRVWDQRKRLQVGSRFLVEDSIRLKSD